MHDQIVKWVRGSALELGKVLVKLSDDDCFEVFIDSPHRGVLFFKQFREALVDRIELLGDDEVRITLKYADVFERLG